MKKIINQTFKFINMEFPILGIVDNDNMLYVFLNDEQFHRTSLDLFERGVMPNERYIDSCGEIYRVKEIINLGYTPFWGFSLLLKGRQIKIKTEFHPVSDRINIDELKRIVIERVLRKKSFWESSWDIDELIEAVNKAKSFQEIINMFK